MPTFNTPVSGGVSEVREPLHPVVQIKLGNDDFLATVPPEHLQDFLFESRQGADKVTITFVDPTFGGIERRIFEHDKSSRPMLLRWGYPGQGLENTQWNKLVLMTYQPTLSYAGLVISIEFMTQGAEFAYVVEPKTYTGKVSSVAKQIAEEMGFNSDHIFIEETDDDINEERKQQWASTHLTRMEMMNKLQSVCKSKTNPNDPYTFKISATGSFHFHTQNYLAGQVYLDAVMEQYKQRYRRFQVLFGVPNGVIQFTPRFEGTSLGPLVRSVLASTLDPRSKQFQQRVLSRETLGMVERELDAKSRTTAKTTAADFKKESDDVSQRGKVSAHAFVPTQQVALGGRCSGKTEVQYAEPERALVIAETAFKNMHQKVQGADLELVGLPDHASFLAEELFCDVLVILPDKNASIPGGLTWEGKHLHWSSGRYRVGSVKHHISAGYTINAELFRAYSLEGSAGVKVSSPERKPTQVAVKTT